MSNKAQEQSWSAVSIHTGTVREVIAAVQSFARDIEQMAAEYPEREICVECRAGTSGSFKMRTLADLNEDDERKD